MSDRDKIILKRKILEQMEGWYTSLKSKKKGLFIKGARQIGKTTVIRNFIKSKYKNIIEINFTEAKKYKKAFAESLIVDDIIKALSALNPNFKFEANNTCFFFDEVQECPLARTAVKFICLDGRFDVIYTSSLLGATYKNDGSSVPVGFEREIMMYPLDFEEFLMSLNYSEENLKYFHEIAEKIRLNNFDFLNCKNSINYILHKEMLNHFNEYVVVGGMPDTVLDFAITHDYNSVFQIQNEIILSYKEDILKYAPKNAKDKVEKTFNLLPSQLAKQNSKLVFSQIVGKKTNFDNFRATLTWLENSWTTIIANNIKGLETPLGLSAIERDVKLFLLDSGLLISCYGIETQKAFLQNKIGNNKGAIYENVFAVILKSKDYPIYFFQKQFNATKEYSNFEIDFVIFKDNKINLIECKSSNSTAKSLNKVISFNKKCVGYKFVNGGFGFNENIKTLPLYMVYYLF